jgi:hypothetical protein
MACPIAGAVVKILSVLVVDFTFSRGLREDSGPKVDPGPRRLPQGARAYRASPASKVQPVLKDHRVPSAAAADDDQL